MRIRRTVLAPAILAIGAAGALIGVPAIAVAAPAAVTPQFMPYHASGFTVTPNYMPYQ